MIHTIPYFDAHCDTIHRCHTAGTLFRDPELRAFYDIAGNLRRSGGHIDLERAGGFSRYAQFFALYQSPQLVPEGSSMPEQGVLLHQRFLREMEENRERILPCRTGAEVDEAVGQGKAAALLSIEGAELLDCDIRRLDTAYDWGVRLLNPVWNYANRLSGSNAQQPEQGLTAYGRDFLQRMEELSIYVDVSHLSDAGFWDVVRLSRRPVVASHSNSRAVCPHRRNLTDDMFRAIRDSGGVAGLNYYQHFVGDDPTMEGLVRHVEHFLELDGERSLCLGGDMDGCELLAGGINRRVEVLIEQGLLEEVEELMRMGMTEDHISMKAIGYKEILAYFHGRCSLETAIDNVKKNTRHYAKKQLTWFRRYDKIKWYNISEYSNDETAVEGITGWLEKNL